MTIGTTLFSTIASRGFNKLQGEIGALQDRISSGKNDPRPSADPMRAVQLSAATEQRAMLDRFAANATTAGDRLAHADLALSDVSSFNRSLKDITIQMTNASLSDEGRAGLRTEAEALRSAILSAANRTDTLGQGLFSGFARGASAFVEGPSGVAYAGDGGQTVVRLSETSRVATGVNGAEAFLAVPTEEGARSLFDMADDLIAALSKPLSGAKAEGSVTNSGRLELPLGRDVQTLTFTLKGPDGSAEITQELPGSLADAINAVSSLTGVTATAEADGEALRLDAWGAISISGLGRSDDPRLPLAALTQLDETGRETGLAQSLMSDRFDATSLGAAFDSAVAHLAEKRAQVGSMAATVERQSEAVAARQVQIKQAMAGLEDLDVAEAVTRLQSLLLTQSASQQTFVKITSQSLFDYLR